MNIARAFTFDFIIYAISRVAAALVWIAIVSGLTSTMSPAEYSIFWQLFTLITGAAGIASSWLVTALRRFYPQHVRDGTIALYYKTAKSSASLCLIVALIAFIPIFWILALLAHWELSAFDALLVLLTFGFALAFLVYCGHLIAVRHSKKYLFLNTAQPILLLILILTLVSWIAIGKITVALLALIISYSIFLPEYLLTSRRMTTERLIREQKAGASSNQVLIYFRFGLPLVIMNLAFVIGNLGTQIIVTRLYSAEAAGIYAAFYAPIERVIGFAATIAATALLPLLAKLWDEGHQREALRFLFVVIVFVTILAAAASAILVVYSDIFTKIMVGSEYSSGSALIPTICVSCLLFSISSIVADVLILQKKTILIAVLFAAANLIGILAALALTSSRGAMGAAEARAISSCLGLLLVVGATILLLSRTKLS